MNILHLKYAVEIKKTGSVKKAAANLYMGQPNLSRAIKELEESLGIIIFTRTARGMMPTLQGEEFLRYAQKILDQIDAMEYMYKHELTGKQKFSISVPRASYVSHAFAEFAKHIETTKSAEIYYKETNSMRAINNILQEDYKLAIIRYQTGFDKYFEFMLDEKGLVYETIAEFSYILLMAKNNPLAGAKNINLKDLSEYIEIVHADPYVPSLPLIDVKKAELSEFVDKRIFVFERASQFDLLSTVPTTFMWVSPIPQELLDFYGLVQRECKGNTKIYRDVLIRRRDYHFTELDHMFISELAKAKRRFL